jgi:hypothetical protein
MNQTDAPRPLARLTEPPKWTLEDVKALERGADALIRTGSYQDAFRLYAKALRLREDLRWAEQ